MIWPFERPDRRQIPCCDCCGEPIGTGERYYELPDGYTVCADGDCLSEWAAPYRRNRQCFEEEFE